MGQIPNSLWNVEFTPANYTGCSKINLSNCDVFPAETKVREDAEVCIQKYLKGCIKEYG